MKTRKKITSNNTTEDCLLSTYSENIRKAIYNARIIEGVSQTEMAAKLKKSQSWFSKFESGASVLSAQEWFVIKDLLGIHDDAVKNGVDKGPLSIKEK